MKIASIKIDKHTLDYEGVRHYLVTHSFIGWLIASQLREKHKIPQNVTAELWLSNLVKHHPELFLELFPNQKINSSMVWVAQDFVEQKLMPEIGKLAKALKLDEKLLRIFIIYDNVPYKINGPKLISHASPLNPITEPGTYMRIDERTTVEDVKSELTKVKKWQQIKRQVIIELQEHASKTDLVKTRRKQIEKGDELAVQDYLAVENKIIKLFQEKASADSTLPDAGYAGELVKPALEMVVGDSLDPDLNDEEFDRQFNLRMKDLENNYYVITRRYALPSQKDKNRIFELMSL
jgi:hypothetical protein